MSNKKVNVTTYFSTDSKKERKNRMEKIKKTVHGTLRSTKVKLLKCRDCYDLLKILLKIFT